MGWTKSLVGISATLAAALVSTGCARSGTPGDSGYTYAVDGLYTGRMMVEGEPFDASLDLRTTRGGRVGGSFNVRAPLEIEGLVDGVVLDDLLRLTLTYESDHGSSASRACEGRVEGVLTVTPGGSVIDGPVTITDCGDQLPGRVSFRRASGTPTSRGR